MFNPFVSENISLYKIAHDIFWTKYLEKQYQTPYFELFFSTFYLLNIVNTFHIHKRVVLEIYFYSNH